MSQWPQSLIPQHQFNLIPKLIVMLPTLSPELHAEAVQYPLPDNRWRGGLDAQQRAKVRQIRQNGVTAEQHLKYDAARTPAKQNRKKETNTDG